MEALKPRRGKNVATEPHERKLWDLYSRAGLHLMIESPAVKCTLSLWYSIGKEVELMNRPYRSKFHVSSTLERILINSHLKNLATDLLSSYPIALSSSQVVIFISRTPIHIPQYPSQHQPRRLQIILLQEAKMPIPLHPQPSQIQPRNLHTSLLRILNKTPVIRRMIACLPRHQRHRHFREINQFPWRRRLNRAGDVEILFTFRRRKFYEFQISGDVHDGWVVE